MTDPTVNPDNTGDQLEGESPQGTATPTKADDTGGTGTVVEDVKVDSEK